MQAIEGFRLINYISDPTGDLWLTSPVPVTIPSL
jgi:hypothetical protein